MQLLQAWRNSLKLFAPQQSKPFILVTIKAVIEAYKLMLYYWWFWFSMLGILSVSVYFELYKPFKLFGFLDLTLLTAAIRHFLFFILCLAMRPSVGRKTLRYFSRALITFWYILVLALLFGLLGFGAVSLFQIFFTFFILFSLDSDGSLNSIVLSCIRAAKMFWYNLPLCFIVYLFLEAFGRLIFAIAWYGLFYFLSFFAVAIMYLFFIPIEIGILSTIYIKKLHEQSELYFKQP